MDLEGMVLEIQRMSTEDGPGLRTTVFLKGCSLHCRWCHNPESIEPQPQVRWSAARCLGCSLCVAACPQGALSLSDGITIDRSRCSACGACVAACPAAAMEMWGEPWQVDDLVSELLKDEAYFGEEGGITVSGGEASLQAPFVGELLSRLKVAGIGTAIDTCGMCSPQAFNEACACADIILYDIKDCNATRHGLNVGGSLALIHDNFRRALGMVAQENKRLWVRTPIIPGMTDSHETIRGIARFMLGAAAAFEGGPALVERWELCAFNNLCSGKYHTLGRAWDLEGADLKSAEEMGALVCAAVAEGWPFERICWTGMIRNES